MRLFTKNMAVLGVAAGLALAGVGCDKTRDELRPNMDTIRGDTRGLQCRDLREMASRLAPKVMQCDDIVRNPFRVTVVMKDMLNKTEDMPGRPMDIYLAKLEGLLNTPETKDRILFVAQRTVTEGYQASEGARPAIGEDVGRAPTVGTRIIPQFALNGTVYSMRNGPTTYYLFKFKLTNIDTGGESWSGDYEVQTLN